MEKQILGKPGNPIKRGLYSGHGRTIFFKKQLKTGDWIAEEYDYGEGKAVEVKINYQDNPRMYLYPCDSTKLIEKIKQDLENQISWLEKKVS